MEPLAFTLALDLNRQQALSARPHAPVVPTRPPRRGGGPGPTRRALAGTLRHLADRLEPCRPPVPAR